MPRVGLEEGEGIEMGESVGEVGGGGEVDAVADPIGEVVGELGEVGGCGEGALEGGGEGV